MQEWNSSPNGSQAQSSFCCLFIYWHRSLIKFIAPVLICMTMGSAHCLMEPKRKQKKNSPCFDVYAWRLWEDLLILTCLVAAVEMSHGTSFLLTRCGVILQWTCVFIFCYRVSERGFQLPAQQNENRGEREKKKAPKRRTTHETNRITRWQNKGRKQSDYGWREERKSEMMMRNRGWRKRKY